MFSSNGISWRQGPHQLAQKFSMTTCPLYWARFRLPPPRAARLKGGAGPLGSALAAAMAPSSATAISVAMRLFISRILSSKVYGRSERRFHVVGELRHSQQVGPEHAILHLDVDRDPVGRQDTVAGTEVHGEAIVARELGAADSAHQIESARQGDASTEKGLARKEVVAEGEIVIRETP